MPLLFAMAGLAEAPWFEMLALLFFGLTFIVVLAVMAVVFRSSVAAVVGALGNAYVTLMFCPWDAFRATANDDPDWQSIVSSWQGLAMWWVWISPLAFAVSIWILWRGPRRLSATEPEEELPALQGTEIMAKDPRFFSLDDTRFNDV